MPDRCPSGYYSKDGKCTKGGSWGKILVVLVIAIVIGVVLYWAWQNIPISGNETPKGQTTYLDVYILVNMQREIAGVDTHIEVNGTGYDLTMQNVSHDGDEIWQGVLPAYSRNMSIEVTIRTSLGETYTETFEQQGNEQTGYTWVSVAKSGSPEFPLLIQITSVIND